MTRPSSSLRRLADVLDCIVDERVGIVRYVREAYRQAGEPDFFHFYAQTGNTKAFSRQESFSRTGGASVDRGLAIVFCTRLKNVALAGSVSGSAGLALTM